LDEALTTGGALERLWPHVEHERAIRTAPTSTPTGSGESIPVDLGLVWSASTAATVTVVGKLWRADMERRSVLLSAAWVASAFAEPIREWLLNRHDEVLQERPGRAVGQSDVDALWAMGEAFTDADQRLGGGYARDTLMHYVNQVVLPLLHGSYRDAIGRELMAATARLRSVCAHMSFDSGRQGLAQRYFIQALRLAQASGNRALGAHILSNMSDQAHHLGNATQALELATAGYRTAVDCGSPSTAARCAAVQGEAHALGGDQQACAQACTIAERTLDRAIPTGERPWMPVFTAAQMTTRRLFMARDLGRTGDVQRIAPAALASSGGMARRHVLCTTELAASYLPAAGNPHSDVDRACELLGQVLPSLRSLYSTRSLERAARWPPMRSGPASRSSRTVSAAPSWRSIPEREPPRCPRPRACNRCHRERQRSFDRPCASGCAAASSADVTASNSSTPNSHLPVETPSSRLLNVHNLRPSCSHRHQAGCEFGSNTVRKVGDSWFEFPRPQATKEVAGVVGGSGRGHTGQDIDCSIALVQRGVQIWALSQQTGAGKHNQP
ncbi:MAG: hypothetical protein ACRDTE_16275, partial [Pseudonocardiaceae bacterium]